MAKGCGGRTPSKPGDGGIAVMEPPKDKKSKSASKGEMVRYPAEFGNMAPGKTTHGLGIKISKKHLGLKQAEALLCGSRLSVRIIKDANVNLDVPNQATFEEPDEDDVLVSVADSKTYKSELKVFSFKLSFNGEEIDAHRLLDFRFEKGYVELERIGNAEASEGEPEEDTEQRRLL